MIMTFKNPIHNTQANLWPLETGVTTLGQPYAEFSELQLTRIVECLCGVLDCECVKFGPCCYDEGGREYLIMIRIKK